MGIAKVQFVIVLRFSIRKLSATLSETTAQAGSWIRKLITNHSKVSGAKNSLDQQKAPAPLLVRGLATEPQIRV